MTIENKENLLEKARSYEVEASKNIPDGQKPKFHFAVPTGWSNDPNGLSYYNGKYHLFYQYNPYAPTFGNMHWGHCTTSDFITWDFLPAALAPDAPYDNNGVFSGSGIEVDGKHVLMYTGVHFLFKTPEDEAEHAKIAGQFEKFIEMVRAGRIMPRQVQSIAIGDGLNYEKLPENPIIPTDMLPENSDPGNFRDPKIWRDEEDNRFYAVVGGHSIDDDGQILLYSSDDLRQWRYEGILYKNNREYGTMWECPDFFALDNKHVLLSSPMGIKGDGRTFSDGSGSVGLIGTYDKATHKFTREHIQMLDYGMDFYAPQTLLSVDGRRILIGWMEKINSRQIPASYTWNGMMTLPREMRIENGKLYAEPVRELKEYYTDPVSHENITVEGSIELKGIQGRYLDMTIDVEAGDYREFAIDVAADGTRKTTIRYEAGESLLSIDRTHSGHEQDCDKIASTYVASQDGKIQLRVILDNCALEVYVNRGEQVMSALVFTPEDAGIIRFTSTNKATFSVKKYGLRLK